MTTANGNRTEVVDVIVVGGGPAGMLSAYYAGKNQLSVLLLEQNGKLGKKLYITGKGRCNVTNDCDMDEFLQCVPRNGRFLYSALSALNTQDLQALFTKNGCPLKVERGQRVYPLSDKASDITKTLTGLLSKSGCKVMLNTKVAELLVEDGQAKGVVLEDGRTLHAKAVVVATGGVSYPGTGSTGDGYAFAKDTGHTITSPLPSLIPFHTKENWPLQLQGLALKNISLTAKKGKKTLYHNQGEMLFTHFGVSGPLVLQMSSYIVGMPYDTLSVSIDMKPALSHEQLHARLQNELQANGKKQLRTLLAGFLPSKMAELFPSICGISSTKIAGQISGAERKTIVDMLKQLPLTLTKPSPIAEAIITRGGVSVKDISPNDMQSKKIRQLYFAGEVIDVDALTGGFNLQIAFSTGALAGQSIEVSPE